MNRSDVYYLPAELEYRRQRAARAVRRGTRWPRNRGVARRHHDEN